MHTTSSCLEYPRREGRKCRHLEGRPGPPRLLQPLPYVWYRFQGPVLEESPHLRGGEAVVYYPVARGATRQGRRLANLFFVRSCLDWEGKQEFRPVGMG